MPPPDTCRIPASFQGSLEDAIAALGGGNPGSTRVLLEWLQVDASAFFGFLSVLDLKHLYDQHIWEVYKLCGQDIHRFIYHVEMELPNQATGELMTTGPYASRVDRATHFAMRQHGKPGSYWALENPPADRNYEYPIQ